MSSRDSKRDKVYNSDAHLLTIPVKKRTATCRNDPTRKPRNSPRPQSCKKASMPFGYVRQPVSHRQCLAQVDRRVATPQHNTAWATTGGEGCRPSRRCVTEQPSRRLPCPHTHTAHTAMTSISDAPLLNSTDSKWRR